MAAQPAIPHRTRRDDGRRGCRCGGARVGFGECVPYARYGESGMISCMVSTSLSIAPALLLTHGASFIDLDGPWWLARDREPAMRFQNGRLYPPRGGWGAPG